MTQHVSALVFDAYGTLFDVESVVGACNAVFTDRGAELSQVWRAKQLQYTWLRSLMGRYVDFWQITEAALVAACGALGLSCDAKTRDRLRAAYLTLAPFPDVGPALKALSGRRLAILSNGTAQMLGAVVGHAGLQSSFSEIISVDEVGIYKPSPRVYQLACDRLGLDRRAIGFVSANGWDVAGAETFGFRTCWLNRTASAGDELGVRPYATARSLAELVTLDW
ncbi:MAG: haloacid dehalogenase type II [Planctomycetaceae bacterium]